MNKKLSIVITVLSLLLIAEVIYIGFGGFQHPRRMGGSADRSELTVGGTVGQDAVSGPEDGQEADFAGNGVMGVTRRDEGAQDAVPGADKNEPVAEHVDKVGNGIEGVDNGEPDIASDGSALTDVISLINREGTTAAERIAPPEGFKRLDLDEGSFGEYLRSLPLKPHGSSVRYYDGGIKPWDVHAAVVDMDVGKRDLQQCADAVIRLRAEYLYANGLFDQIHFNFTNGFNAKYSKWSQGYRISITGNKAVWVEMGSKGTEYESFRKYLDTVFAYAGTLSLSQEMDKINLKDMQPGDVFLKGGSPGHCVIVTDMAENQQTGERVFLIAQSYMPAQDIHILRNPANEDENPWYPAEFGDELVTPEWTFSKDQVYRFGD